MALILVTGPVRSGKSRFAERLALERGGPVTYVATAHPAPDDDEWRARLAHHAARRPSEWEVLESALVPGGLAAVVRATAGERTLVVDSLGTWLAACISDRLRAGGESAALDAVALEDEAGVLALALTQTAAHAIVVGEEVGWSIVPAYASGRVFRDVLGRLQQQLAMHASHVYLVVSGIAVDLRALGMLVGEPGPAAP